MGDLPFAIYQLYLLSVGHAVAQFACTVCLHSLPAQSVCTVCPHSLSAQFARTVCLHSLPAQSVCTVCLHSLSAQFACTVACTVCTVCQVTVSAQCVGAPLQLFPPCSSEPTYLYGLLKSLCIEHYTQRSQIFYRSHCMQSWNHAHPIPRQCVCGVPVQMPM